ncbi:pyrroloquinoline quinone biosynthesis protein PqqB [Ideonella alba]|uniref:Coenzyme PQQ synthesis protein B n=1 Tax=Ideonella alba TaxID=2824118 RepID=A0A941BIU4_9BURK|nr:pyrroloquinoline quinone biosynthesis protein PqqB [Ideonella alba]MBQ0933093.1 pyrroloquinoline quinone biosynthesis protein PqqB [Ideonella alba]
MKLIVLGAAAGGGFPQWNCNCTQCAGVRAGRPGLRRRTQSSVIVGDGADWVLVNASPDILQQIQATPALQPARQLRDTGIRGVLLVDGQIDHTTGLFMLRERGSPLPLWCTDPVHDDLTQGNPILRVLGHFCGVDRHTVTPDGAPFEVPGVAGLRVRALPLWSKPAPFSPHREHNVVGDNVGYLFENTANGRTLFYAPGLAEIDPTVWEVMNTANVVMVDGTFWTDDEMIRLGISSKRGSEIGHLPQSGAGGMLEWLSKLPASTRKLLIHINNTNPILDEHSPERAACTAAGVEVSHDGLEIDL